MKIMSKQESLHFAFNFLINRRSETTGICLQFTEDELLKLAEKFYNYANS